MNQAQGQNQSLRPSSKMQDKIRRRVGKPSTMEATTSSIRKADKLTIDMKAKLTQSYFQRKQVLRIPQEILDSNPDKKFAFIKYQKVVDNNGYHPNGYTPYKLSEEDKSRNPLGIDGGSSDGLFHRNEMILAHIPKAEYEQRQLEEQVVRGSIDLTQLVTQNQDLAECDPHAELVTEKIEKMEEQ